MSKKSEYFVLLFLINLWTITYSQEIHFSQFSNNPLLINPSLIGNMGGEFEIGATYRRQGDNISVPYTTYSAWGDIIIDLHQKREGSVGIGVGFYNDNAGDGGLKTTSGTIAATFIKSFNYDNSFRAALGFSLGFINRSIDYSKLVFDNQWNGTVFDPTIASQEPFTDNSIFAPDFNAGGLLVWRKNDNLIINVGGGLHHINYPKLTFYKSENTVERKILIHSSVHAKISDFINIFPAICYSVQGKANEMLIGTNIYFVKNDLKLITGLWYRVERDIIPHVGIVIDGLIVEFSYDVNVSKLHLASNYRGGLEVSLVKTISKTKRSNGCYGF